MIVMVEAMFVVLAVAVFLMLQLQVLLPFAIIFCMKFDTQSTEVLSPHGILVMDPPMLMIVAYDFFLANIVLLHFRFLFRFGDMDLSQ